MIDTHVALWLTSDPGKLQQPEKVLLGRPDSEIFASAVSIWELPLEWNGAYIAGARDGVAVREVSSCKPWKLLGAAYSGG